MTLRFGDIVIVGGLADPRGRNPKDRPAVVVTPTDQLAAGGPIFVVAITTTLPDPRPEDHVPLPWQRPRHPRTGLNARNAVVCHWLAQVEEGNVERVIGRASNLELSRIDAELKRLAEQDQP